MRYTRRARRRRRLRPLPIAADYEIIIHGDHHVSVKNNVDGSLDMTSDTSGTVESNVVDSSADIVDVTNVTLTNNNGECLRDAITITVSFLAS